MSAIDFPTFLAQVSADELNMLTTFIVGVDVQAQADEALADQLFAQAQHLDSMGLFTEMHRIYTHDNNGNALQSFRAIVSPQAAGYVAQLARERVVLSREPLP